MGNTVPDVSDISTETVIHLKCLPLSDSNMPFQERYICQNDTNKYAVAVMARRHYLLRRPY